jgi:hypothetical protein
MKTEPPTQPRDVVLAGFGVMGHGDIPVWSKISQMTSSKMSTIVHARCLSRFAAADRNQGQVGTIRVGYQTRREAPVPRL